MNKCRICKLGGRWAIGCTGYIFITNYPKIRTKGGKVR